jgi:isoleucyl-tRNA synthetase
MYSTKLATPISNFEVAMDDTYGDVNDPAITVKFQLSDMLALGPNQLMTTYVLAWTTTPRTIPANLALAVNRSMTYDIVQIE